MLCYAMLCYAMLCYAMLCYTILHYTIIYQIVLVVFGEGRSENLPLGSLHGVPRPNTTTNNNHNISRSSSSSSSIVIVDINDNDDNNKTGRNARPEAGDKPVGLRTNGVNTNGTRPSGAWEASRGLGEVWLIWGRQKRSVVNLRLIVFLNLPLHKNMPSCLRQWSATFMEIDGN